MQGKLAISSITGRMTTHVLTIMTNLAWVLRLDKIMTNQNIVTCSHNNHLSLNSTHSTTILPPPSGHLTSAGNPNAVE